MADFSELTHAVIDGNGKKVIEIVNAGLAEGVEPQALLSEYMIPGMLEVGRIMPTPSNRPRMVDILWQEKITGC